MDTAKHTLSLPEFDKLLDVAVQFFKSSPMLALSEVCATPAFNGVGVYGLYYSGKDRIYGDFFSTRLDLPIYVGKAVSKGWRQGRRHGEDSNELSRRVREHGRSIDKARNLNSARFCCRIVIVPIAQSDIIGALEARLIQDFRPMWNACVDGFGNHDPGSGRHNQKKSHWDIIHPGREWADKLTGASASVSFVQKKIDAYKESFID